MRTSLVAVAILAALTLPAHAQAAAAPAIDLTAIILAIIGGAFSIIVAIATAVINSRMKDGSAKDTIRAAVQNGLGAMEMATRGLVKDIKPEVQLLGVTPKMQIGVQYVLDHAGEELGRFGITPAAVADKLVAQIGLDERAKKLVADVAEVEPKRPVPPAPPHMSPV